MPGEDNPVIFVFPATSGHSASSKEQGIGKTTSFWVLLSHCRAPHLPLQAELHVEAGVALNDFSGFLFAHLGECRSQMLYYVLLMPMPVQRNTEAQTSFQNGFHFLKMTDFVSFIYMWNNHINACIPVIG